MLYHYQYLKNPKLITLSKYKVINLLKLVSLNLLSDFKGVMYPLLFRLKFL
jgi:hypothetical protein